MSNAQLAATLWVSILLAAILVILILENMHYWIMVIRTRDTESKGDKGG